MPVQLNGSTSGSVTLTAPAVAGTTTLTLPATTGTINASGTVNEVPAGSAAAPSIYPTGDTNTGMFFPAADTIAFTEGGAEAMRIDSSGNVGIGTTDTSLFNSVGGTTRLAVCGSSASTDILGNTAASISIINTDTTANNTAGLHFARADTDDTPNYAGASIVAQFPDTQVASQYPKGLLTFLTSTVANSAPSEKMRIAANGDLSFNSGYGSAAVAYGCRAWVNFDGTGTVAIRASGNVTSITDNGTGNYTINFTTALVDVNYSGVFGCNDNGNTTTINYKSSGTKSTTAFQISTIVTAATAADNNMCMVAIFR